MEENFFSDESIFEQSVAMIRTKDGRTTNGVVITVIVPNEAAVEIVLEYEELKVLMKELETDRKCNPHIYGDNK